MNSPDLDSVDEQLTAYLDGELSAQEAASIENRLVDDSGLRVRLAELRKAYDLLDELPETPHNQLFTRSTVELVVKDLSTTQPHLHVPIVKPRIVTDWWAWPRVLVMIGLFVGTGVATGFVLRFLRISRELRDLGLIASLPGMSAVNELSVAIELSKEKAAIEILRRKMRDRLIPAVPDSVWQRKAWVQNLTPLQLAKLDSGRDGLRKLDRLDPNTHARFSAIESQIENRPDSEQVQAAIHIISLELDKLSTSEREDLEGMNREQRTIFLKERLCLSAARIYATQMSAADMKAIEEWNSKFFKPALFEELQPPRFLLESRDGSDPSEQSREQTRVLISTLWRWRPVERGFQLENQDSLIAELLPTLSDTGKSLLEGINKNYQLRVLSSWIGPNLESSTLTLIDTYEKIDKTDRDARERLDLEDPQHLRRNIDELNRRRIRGTPRSQ